MRSLTAGSSTTTNRQGWVFAPEGADAATRSASSTSARGTGSDEKCRTLRRRRIKARNARLRAWATAAGRRVKLRGCGRYLLTPSLTSFYIVRSFQAHEGRPALSAIDELLRNADAYHDSFDSGSLPLPPAKRV